MNFEPINNSFGNLLPASGFTMMEQPRALANAGPTWD
jgi:hypothetical protein